MTKVEMLYALRRAQTLPECETIMIDYMNTNDLSQAERDYYNNLMEQCKAALPKEPE